MTGQTPDLSAVIRGTDDALRQYAATPSALDGVLRSQRARMAEAAKTVRVTDIPLLSPALDKMTAEHVRKLRLPPGIHGGALTAIVAGAAVAGGVLYALTRKKKESMGAWTDRIETERTNTLQRDLSR